MYIYPLYMFETGLVVSGSLFSGRVCELWGYLGKWISYSSKHSDIFAHFILYSSPVYLFQDDLSDGVKSDFLTSTLTYSVHIHTCYLES